MASSLITKLEQELAVIHLSLLYVPNSTIFYFDDDHLRAISSRAVSLLTNLRQMNNPAKALGPVCNAMCSALTSSYMAGTLSASAEREAIWSMARTGPVSASRTN